MKIRSILAELEVVDCRAATELALNQEVVCITAVDLAARASEARVTPLGMRELVLCRPGDFGGPWTPPGTVSLVLYHAAIPDDAVHASTSCIVAATSLPISKAFERFDRIPQQVVAIDAMKGRLFDTFQHTHNIRQFVQRAYNVLGLPTIVVNTDGRILAHVGEFSDAREDIAAQLKTGYIAPEVQAVIDRDCIVENARAKHYPDASHDISNDENWVTSVVYYKRLELGRFDVYKPQGAFTGYDLELIDYAGSLAGIIIDRMTDVATSSNQGASVLSDILDGRFTQTKDATGRLADAGVDTSGAYAMLTVEGERLFASPTYSSHVGRLMKDVFPHGIWVTHRNTFCMLLPMPHIDGPAFPYYEKLEELTLDNPPLAALLVNNSLRAYVSEPFENILLCPVGFEECIQLSSAVDDDSIVSLHWHHRLRAMAVSVANASHRGTRLLCDQRILAALDYDRAKGTEYIATIKAFLEHPGDATAASNELYVHRNTFFYRLRKAREMFSIPLDTGEDMLSARFTIEVALSMPDLLDRGLE